MAQTLDGVLVVAISSRALFDFEEENSVFDDPDQGVEPYMQLHRDRLETPAKPGLGFNLCRKLLALNEKGAHLTEVVVLSRSDPISGLRTFNSAKHHNLAVTRGAFLSGDHAPFRYLAPLQADLFLSANADDVKKAIETGFAAAQVFPRSAEEDPHPHELRIAFDGDSVLFSDEAERVYRLQNLDGFNENETSKAREPLEPGPFQPFLKALHNLQKHLGPHAPMKIKTCLITARGAPSHERAMKTLMHWGIRIDQAFFLNGLPKTEFLAVFKPDFFFDDQLGHIEPARGVVPSGHVPYGIANEPQSETKPQ